MRYNQLKEKIDKMTTKLKEQEQIESFIENDIDHWTKQLEQIKMDVNGIEKN